MNKFIFLDIDGVMNSNLFYEVPKYRSGWISKLTG